MFTKLLLKKIEFDFVTMQHVMITFLKKLTVTKISFMSKKVINNRKEVCENLMCFI